MNANTEIGAQIISSQINPQMLPKTHPISCEASSGEATRYGRSTAFWRFRAMMSSKKGSLPKALL